MWRDYARECIDQRKVTGKEEGIYERGRGESVCTGY